MLNSDLKNSRSGLFVNEIVQGTDGVWGRFKGDGEYDTGGFGKLVWGHQYITFYLKPIGRFGTYSTDTHMFQPFDGTRLDAEHAY